MLFLGGIISVLEAVRYASGRVEGDQEGKRQATLTGWVRERDVRGRIGARKLATRPCDRDRERERWYLPDYAGISNRIHIIYT